MHLLSHLCNLRSEWTGTSQEVGPTNHVHSKLICLSNTALRGERYAWFIWEGQEQMGRSCSGQPGQFKQKGMPWLDFPGLGAWCE
eukprot:1137559-Pelagomonas_calceolata.AAC.2